ncbi:hypothetical protein [Archangium lansingense]|uniref:Uncharacterized protein n=1 Tax=Archangium lansingense TaxID=2995310 RepID=A0ABT4A7P7_9BACT|nr:hypothetical protein [Archangium lansinium]MCY1076972.1 hypothetical protein [Archangium lansinium]
MKRLAPAIAALACVLAFAAPAQAQQVVQLQEKALSTRLASTVTTIQPQCWYCTALTVTAFDIVAPSGTVSHNDAAWAAIDYLGAQQYDAGTAISQATFASRLANWNYEELPPEIRTYVGTYGTNYTVSESYWGYMSAPDYCNYGHFYMLVFNQARKVLTVEVSSEHEC